MGDVNPQLKALADAHKKTRDRKERAWIESEIIRLIQNPDANAKPAGASASMTATALNVSQLRQQLEAAFGLDSKDALGLLTRTLESHTKPRRPPGRPSTQHETNATIRRLFREGATVQAMAEATGLSEKSIRNRLTPKELNLSLKERKSVNRPK